MQAESQKLEAARINGVVRMITQLQAEGKNVLSQKLALLDIRESAVASSLSEQIGRDSQQRDSGLKEAIEANKEQVS